MMYFTHSGPQAVTAEENGQTLSTDFTATLLLLVLVVLYRVHSVSTALDFSLLVARNEEQCISFLC